MSIFEHFFVIEKLRDVLGVRWDVFQRKQHNCLSPYAPEELLEPYNDILAPYNDIHSNYVIKLM